jgi:peptide/nickel transport system ATP-binding protein
VSIIAVRGLVKDYRGVRALDDINLDVAAGTRFGIVGESGSGKSTLVRLIMGLDTPTAGTIAVDGHPVAGRPPHGVAQIVFQDPLSSLDPRMRIRHIIAESLRAADPERVTELLDAVGLSPAAANRYPHEFSGGQRQRIAIARALAPRPQILIADEPVSALDVSVRAQILNLLMDLTTRFGLTLVFVSHDLSVIRHLTEELAVMRSGRIVETGRTSEVYAAPTHDYTRELIAAIPRLRG